MGSLLEYYLVWEMLSLGICFDLFSMESFVSQSFIFGGTGGYEVCLLLYSTLLDLVWDQFFFYINKFTYYFLVLFLNCSSKLLKVFQVFKFFFNIGVIFVGVLGVFRLFRGIVLYLVFLQLGEQLFVLVWIYELIEGWFLFSLVVIVFQGFEGYFQNFLKF